MNHRALEKISCGCRKDRLREFPALSMCNERGHSRESVIVSQARSAESSAEGRTCEGSLLNLQN